MSLEFAYKNILLRNKKLSGELNIGGLVCFEGVVREFNNNKQVSYLFYEACENLAQKIFLDLEDYVKKNYKIKYISAQHKLGKVFVGECAVKILVGSSHRSDAFSAAKYLIDQLKIQIPIWKKEVYIDGSHNWGSNLCGCDVKLAPDFFKPVDKALKIKNISRASLEHKKICVIGLGGLGCPIIFNLAALGFKNFVLFDFDKINFSNLARQFFYTKLDIGEYKINICERFLRERFLDLDLNLNNKFFNTKNNLDLISNCDLIIDASDDYFTKYELKKFSWEKKFNLIIASVWGDQGEVHVFNKNSKISCLNCFQTKNNNLVLDCLETGVLTHGCFNIANYVSEVVLELFSQKTNLDNFSLISMGGLSGVQKINYKPDPNCHVCGAKKDLREKLFINREEFLNKQGKYIIIDIRKDYEQKSCPLSITHKKISDLKNIFACLKNSNLSKFVLVCEQGARAHKLVLECREQGFKNIFCLSGGRRALRGLSQ